MMDRRLFGFHSMSYELNFHPRKISTMIEVDDVLDAFRKTGGSDWQNQINHILKQWLQTHSLEHSIL